MNKAASYPEIAYGRAYFKGIRLEGCLYVDKTRFLRDLEKERYVVFIRPRRFGKTCWLSLLESYYDRTQAEDFEAVFDTTDIGLQPTANRSRYVVLWLDFSAFNDAFSTLEKRFDEYCVQSVRHALECNADLFPAPARERILAQSNINGMFNALFLYARDRGIPLYVLIDEYDNFTNTTLVHQGAEAYRSFTHGSGFYRNFFATLKAGTATGGLERLFITGVSPVTMDDVTNGFNIGKNISLDLRFNEMLGFTEDEVRGALHMYHGLGVLDQDPDATLNVMREWYDGYRFAKGAGASLYNTDMVLHYLSSAIPNRLPPDELIDFNVRVDYAKLRHLLLVNQGIAASTLASSGSWPSAAAPDAEPKLNGNFDLLRHVAGEGSVDADIVTSFPLERLGDRENFVSLLHYFGLLSIRGTSAGVPRLGIPNQTVRRLLYGYLRDAYRDVGVFSIDLYRFDILTREMARDGAWRAAIEYLSDAIAKQTSIRDYIDGEKVIQGFLAAYLSASNYFVFHTERELGKGYADMLLEPLVSRYSGMRHGYILELKYLKRSAAANAAQVATLARKAAEQLGQYLADERLAEQYPSVRFTGLALVFHGWEMVHSEAVR